MGQHILHEEQKYLPFLRVKFAKPTGGYWDGGARSGGDFTPEKIDTDAAGKYVTWGCWSLNFYFNTGFGRSWDTAAAYAKRRLQRLLPYQATVEIIKPAPDVHARNPDRGSRHYKRVR